MNLKITDAVAWYLYLLTALCAGLALAMWVHVTPSMVPFLHYAPRCWVFCMA